MDIHCSGGVHGYTLPTLDMDRHVNKTDAIVCTYVRMYVYIYVCMHACMSVCVCMYVCMCIHL